MTFLNVKLLNIWLCIAISLDIARYTWHPRHYRVSWLRIYRGSVRSLAGDARGVILTVARYLWLPLTGRVTYRADRKISRDVGTRSMGLLGGALLERRGGSSDGVSANWRAIGCTLRGPVDCGRLNVYRSLVVFARITAVRRRNVFAITGRDRVLSTGSENARSRWSERLGNRVLSTESENARSRCSEYQDVEYSRRRARTLAPGDWNG